MKPRRILKISCIIFLAVFIMSLIVVVIMGNMQGSDEIELPAFLGIILVLSGLLSVLSLAAMFVMRLVSDIKDGNKRRILNMLPQTAVLTGIFYLADRFIFKDSTSLLNSFFTALVIVTVSYAAEHISNKNQ